MAREGFTAYARRNRAAWERWDFATLAWARRRPCEELSAARRI
jgi:hypothetical protein